MKKPLLIRILSIAGLTYFMPFLLDHHWNGWDLAAPLFFLLGVGNERHSRRRLSASRHSSHSSDAKS